MFVRRAVLFAGLELSVPPAFEVYVISVDTSLFKAAVG
jgi:hypothetical protein